MEHILAFVFGVVIGAVLLQLIHSVIGVSKLNKKYKEQQNELDGLHHAIETHFSCLVKDVKELDKRTHREVDEIYQNFDKLKREAESHTDKVYDKLAKKIAELVMTQQNKPAKVKKEKIEQLNS